MGVIDYGMGNLLSVCRAVEYCGAEAVSVSGAEDFRRVDRIILPGVGAFKDGMHELNARGLIEPILAFAHSGNPLLGICLGMQMMMESSEEFGKTRGIGLFAGEVRAIPSMTGQIRRKIPHIGWNVLHEPMPGRWGGTLLEDLCPAVSSTYFVHSFCAHPMDERQALAYTYHDAFPIVAAIGLTDLPVWGCQFHPEKSGECGIAILRRFCAASPMLKA